MSNDQLYENVYYSRGVSNKNHHKPELLQKTQEQADEIIEIMYENVNKVMERQEKLDDLNEAAESLERQASVFKTHTVVLKRKERWAHMKTKIIMGIIATILLIILIVSLLSSLGVI